jgi:hypothetical protein
VPIFAISLVSKRTRRAIQTAVPADTLSRQQVYPVGATKYQKPS